MLFLAFRENPMLFLRLEIGAITVINQTAIIKFLFLLSGIFIGNNNSIRL